MKSERLTIVMSGMVAGDPGHGGASWAVLQYVLGLKRLGHDVYLVEPLRATSDDGSDTIAQSDAATYFHHVTRRFGLETQAALVQRGTRQTVGLPYEQLLHVARRADVLINVSGMLDDPAILEPIPRRIYLDLDPAFIQLWHFQGIDMRFAAHTHFVTIGLAIGTPECPVPTCGIQWLHTLQPMVLEYWPLGTRIQYHGLTTVANWRGYGSVEHDGVFYGQKAHSLRQFIDLPRRSSERFMPALAIHPGETADLAALNENGWHLLDPARVTNSPDAYQRFIQESKAEFGIAKSGYVVSGCGWFSDRSVCYLASGRPVIAQETGFSRYLPTREGLFAFETAEDVMAAIDAIGDYERHSRAARRLAEEFFDSDKVLAKLLGEILA